MKLQNVKDVRKLFEVVDSCKGKVELVTGEGDRLNLKSKLSQYISLSGIFKDGVPEIPEMEIVVFKDGVPEIPEMEIVAYDPEDVQKLFNFMVNG